MTPFLEKIIHAAAGSALVLTSNKRLSRHLQTAYDRQMQALGKQTWPTPQIFSLDAWLDRRIVDLGESWRLLQAPPLKRLWEQIIEEDSAGSDKELLQLSATAEKARQASQLLGEYHLSLANSPLTEDQQAFQRWLQRYQRLCAEHNWLDRTAAIALVLAALQRQQLECPHQLLLVGFDQFSPLVSALGQQIKTFGGSVEELGPEPSSANQIGRHGCNDPQDEIVQAARWARALLEQGAAAVGVVVTDLQARRSQVERIFRDQIDPEAVLRLNEEESAFSLSLGSPLIEQGPIHAALEILAVGHRLGLDQCSFLLRTAYLKASIAEADSRALLDSRLRSFRQQSFRLTRLSILAKTDNQALVFGRCLDSLDLLQKSISRKMPGEWAAQFDATLIQVGWPGERSLASSEYQMVMAWRDKLLPALASLDAVSPPVERHQALSLLRRLAAETEFQLEAPTGPVQVVGLLESAGLEFEHLWVMGMTEDILPAAARPNPFLPVALQVAQQMPHSSAERELDFARQVIGRLRAAGKQSIFSYALRDGDCDLRPSPLILDLPERTPMLAEPADLRTKIQAQAIALSELSDTLGPSLASEQGTGGTGILKDQALCPFRAFAHYRLRGKSFDQAEPGLDAMTRGNLLHLSLEIFWTSVMTQVKLLSLTDPQRLELVNQSVVQALEQYFKEQPTPQPGLLEIEQQRLVALIEEWLTNTEQARASFQVVQREKELLAQIGPLQIRTVIDRVDMLDDGSLVILDYKTGAVRAELLVGERLLEPQLPIYAITNSEQAADGVAFAQLRRGSCKLIGVAREEGLLPKVAGVEKNNQALQLGLHSWTDLLAHWRRQLEALAEDFVAGIARVDPVDYEHACKFCDLTGLCRIAEAKMIGEEE